MDPIILTVCDDFDSTYSRFSYYAAVIIFDIPLNKFWKNDTLFNSIIKQLNKCFNNWTLQIQLRIEETGG